MLWRQSSCGVCLWITPGLAPHKNAEPECGPLRWKKACRSRRNEVLAVALDGAMKRLAEFDERKSKVVELRFFGGLSVEETAAVLNVSPFTVIRDWNLAKAWLQREIRNRTP
jgi:DNA-directed RNA polymerase specialized sigma subunit